MICPKCGAPQSRGLVQIRREFVVAGYALGIVLSWFLAGGLLQEWLEGQRRDTLQWWKAWAALPVLWLSVGGHFLRWHRWTCADCKVAAPAWLLRPLPAPPTALPSVGPTRRRVLRGAAAMLAGAVATAASAATAALRNRNWVPIKLDVFWGPVERNSPRVREAWRGAAVRSYRRLGRTNALVSDISMGCGNIYDGEVVHAAIDRGINYFDTSPDYSFSLSETLVGKAVRGRRDKVFVATKFCVKSGHLPDHTPVPEIIRSVEESLTRLGTDYVDLIHIHSCDSVARLMAPNMHEAFDRLKEQGKVRFLGVSTHTPNLEAVANRAIDCGRFDVIMLAYHFGMWRNFGHILDKARAHDVAVVAMKTLKGAKHTNLAAFRNESGSYSQAAFRWVLANPSVSCLVISILRHDDLDEYLYASGTTAQNGDVALLEKYDRLTAGDYCQPHCGACLDSCTAGLPINDMLRYRMYFKDYGWEQEGPRLYARLRQNAAVCLRCSAPCAGTCPIGVPIRDKLLDAHRVLGVPA